MREGHCLHENLLRDHAVQRHSICGSTASRLPTARTYLPLSAAFGVGCESRTIAAAIVTESDVDYLMRFVPERGLCEPVLKPTGGRRFLGCS